MQSDYHIEDLVYQTGDLVVFRARNKNGIPHAVSRVKFPYEILSGLEGGRFEEAYEELLTFKGPSIRNVVDGGQDPVDKFPWVATKWWNGAILSKKLEEGPLTEEELLRIRASAESLIQTYGDRAAAFAFKPQSVIITRSAEGAPIDTFAIDYFAWFRDWSLGHPPGSNRDPERELDKMMESLQHRPSTNGPVTPQALQQPEPVTPPPPPPKPPQAASPLVLTPASAAAATPAAQVTLPSSSSGGGLKAVFIITLLLGLVAGGLWWIKNQPPKADPQVENTASPDTGNKAPDTPESPEKGSVTPDTPPPKITTIPDTPRPVEPRRPSLGQILEADPSNPISLKRFVGQWVFVNTVVDHLDGNKTIHLKDTPLKATLKRGSISLDPNTRIKLIGILKTQTHLEVPDNTDVEVIPEMEILPPKDVYSVEDEKQLRSMAGEKVTVEGKVLGYKTSTTGKTFYLLLNDTKPEFAFSIRSHLASSPDFNEEFLKSLIGKIVKATGSVKVDEIGDRLNIYYKYRSHLEVSEE